jgi:hypothetical protein
MTNLRSTNHHTDGDAKPMSQKAKHVTTRLFSADFEMAAFLGFNAYRRPSVEAIAEKGKVKATPANPAATLRQAENDGDQKKYEDAKMRSPSQNLDEPSQERRLVNRLSVTPVATGIKADRKRAKVVAKLMREFEACQFEGPSDWMFRKSFKDNLREALSDYFSETGRSVHVQGDKILLPTRYLLSGQQIGPFCYLEPANNIRKLVVEVLVWKSRRTLGLLWTLAEGGQSEALLKLAQIVVPLVKAINEKASADSSIMGCWPKDLPYWPVLKSPHHDFDCDHPTLLKSLQVGDHYPFNIAEEARWTARDAIGKWAIHLCQEIEVCQECLAVYEDSEPWEHKLEKLRPFSSETWKDWWEIAKDLLQDEYIDVVEIPELNNTVKSKADRKSPGVIRKRILQALKDKFKSMGSENKVRITASGR